MTRQKAVLNWIRQRMIGLLCAVLNVVSYSLYTFYVLVKLPYHVLYTYVS
jgi:hypothetical protein